MTFRIALAQINATVGDVWGNADRIIQTIDAARRQDADLVAFPEQVVSGYPPEDLLLKPQFLAACRAALEHIATQTENICAVVGFPESAQDVYNATAVCYDGKLVGIYRKIHLPNYAVFDEMRYFLPGDKPAVLDLGRARVGLSICEDIWVPGRPETDEVLHGGAQVIINISASPFYAGKARQRARMLAARANDLNAYVAFVNLVGGQDELIFDGNSLVLDHLGNVVARAKAFEQDLLLCDLDLDAVDRYRLHDPRFRSEKRTKKTGEETIRILTVDPPLPALPDRPLLSDRLEPEPEQVEEVYRALVLGCRDYIRKNGFSKVVLGLSGGVDSALSATIAADALGAPSVVTLFMPSPYSSADSRQDAMALAANLGIECIEVPITPVFEAYRAALDQHFQGKPEDTTEENLQARIRGNYLMAFSNKFGYLVLSTGNKSENSVGYATLYGDMAGGFNLIKDVPKDLVYRLCRYRNDVGDAPVLPERILTKEPTAELREGQKDSDSLPPYPTLDAILKFYVEEDFSFDQIVAEGYDPQVVSKVIGLVDRNEYKRRQACPGIKITPRAFGKDRRLPITNRYSDGTNGNDTSK